MGKKAKKPGKGKEKTERKTAKAEEKKARRDSKKISEEDDIDAILMSIQKEEAKKKEIQVEDNVPAPSPRSNCSLNINPTKEIELILYGGEFYNGSKTFVYGDLYRYDVEKREWKLVSSPNSPPPRSAHQAVAWKNHLYIFGGEFTSPNQERFHHYKDFWMVDLKSNQWEQLLLKGCPSARSGHRMVLYKHKIIVFGGFYDTLREVRYYNDLHVFDLDQFKWQEIKPTPGCMWPSARSGFQFFVFQDEIFLYGGYSKEVASDKNSSEKGIVHSDMWSLDPKTWEWSKIKKSGMPPGPRAGFSVCVHKKRALLFGGVVDMEVEGYFFNPQYRYAENNETNAVTDDIRKGLKRVIEKLCDDDNDACKAIIEIDTYGRMDGSFGERIARKSINQCNPGDVLMSLFLNELYGFQLDCRRWYPLELRKDKPIKDKSKGNKKSDQLSNGYPLDYKSSQNDLQNAEANERDEDLKSYEAGSSSGVFEDVSHHMTRNLTFDDGECAHVSEGKPQEQTLNSDQASISSEAVKPCGRINSCMVVARDTLYMYGGMMEVRDQEITLDDLYMLNLSKLDEWKCIIPASKCEWLDNSEDDDEDDTEDEPSDSGSDSDETDEEDDGETRDDGEKALGMGDAVAIIKGKGKNLRRKEKRARIEQIRANLGLSDSQRTPMPGESLKDFYKRTSMYWQMAAHEHTQHTGKELRKDGFDLAEARFRELKPILDELAVLEAEQKAEEEEGAETSSRKRGNKKNKHLSSQR